MTVRIDMFRINVASERIALYVTDCRRSFQNYARHTKRQHPGAA